MNSITHVLTSPMLRTIQTTFGMFAPFFKNGKKAILWLDLREWGSDDYNATSQGIPLEQLKIKTMSNSINRDLMSEGWEILDETEEEDFRIMRVREELSELARLLSSGVGGKWKGISFEAHEGDVGILVVSHGGFLYHLLDSDCKFGCFFFCD